MMQDARYPASLKLRLSKQDSGCRIKERFFPSSRRATPRLASPRFGFRKFSPVF